MYKNETFVIEMRRDAAKRVDCRPCPKSIEFAPSVALNRHSHVCDKGAGRSYPQREKRGRPGNRPQCRIVPGGLRKGEVRSMEFSTAAVVALTVLQMLRLLYCNLIGDDNDEDDDDDDDDDDDEDD